MSQGEAAVILCGGHLPAGPRSDGGRLGRAACDLGDSAARRDLLERLGGQSVQPRHLQAGRAAGRRARSGGPGARAALPAPPAHRRGGRGQLSFFGAESGVRGY